MLNRRLFLVLPAAALGLLPLPADARGVRMRGVSSGRRFFSRFRFRQRGTGF